MFELVPYYVCFMNECKKVASQDILFLNMQSRPTLRPVRACLQEPFFPKDLHSPPRGGSAQLFTTFLAFSFFLHSFLSAPDPLETLSTRLASNHLHSFVSLGNLQTYFSQGPQGAGTQFSSLGHIHSHRSTLHGDATATNLPRIQGEQQQPENEAFTQQRQGQTSTPKHLLHPNSRCLDPSTKPQTRTARTVCLFWKHQLYWSRP